MSSVRAVRLTAQEERSVRSIASALESLAAAAPGQQEDLFGGPLELVPSAYSNYYALLAQRICRQAGLRASSQP